jgi:hypothetical protein
MSLTAVAGPYLRERMVWYDFRSMERTEPQTGRTPSSEDRLGQVARVLGSATFSNAPGLKSFLQFIVSLAEAGRGDEISEYAIATQVFGRPPKFDPASDTIVRTQAYRLRLKLKEYYEGEGKDDGIAIEVPKGHYVPVFQSRAGTSVSEPVTPIEVPMQPEPAAAPPATVRDKRWMRPAAVALLALAMFLGGAAVGARWLDRRQAVSAASPVQGVENQFWSSFFNSNRHILVSFWDFDYLVSEGNVLLPAYGSGLRVERAAPAEPKAAGDPKLAAMAGRLYYENGYAALGDMLGVQRLSMLFTNLGAATTAVRAHQLTLEELKNNDLVFLGRFEDRGNLVWLPEEWPWRFAAGSGPDMWSGYIVDTAAKPGANSRFVLGRDPGSRVIRTDYALVSVIPGVNPAHRVAILGGLTTTGTQGAAEFMSSEAGLRELLAAIGVKQNGRLVFPRFFQCVLRVEVAHGIDVITTKYVTGAAFQPK